MDANAITSPSSLKAASSDSIVVPASALPIGEILKEYVITGIIGEGGFGIVYAAQDTLLQRNVAIKEYMPAAIANRLASTQITLRSVRHQQAFDAGMQGFIDESRLLAQFKHPALVEILRFWEANGTAYMVMPHYSGKTLRNLLRLDRNACSEAWLKSILSPILDATELLHSNNIFHRDIAPDNIVIQDNGQPVLLDLGSARRVIAGMQSALTVVVKPGYAPIEQYTDDTTNEQGPWTDIYALGAVLYFSITGSAPSASVSRMMRDNLKPLTSDDFPQFSDKFLAAVNRALQLRPSDRFQSVAEFREALHLNTAFAAKISFAPQPVKSEATALPEDTDNEVTQILTDDEINQFKEKLLHTLAKPVPSNQASPSVQATQQEFNTNILQRDVTAKNDTISSFDDVKELLENKPSVTPKKTNSINTPKSSGKIDTATNSQVDTPSPKKQWPLVIRTVISGALVATVLLVCIYLLNDTNGNDADLTVNITPTLDQAPLARLANKSHEPADQPIIESLTANNLDAQPVSIHSIVLQDPAPSEQSTIAITEPELLPKTEFDSTSISPESALRNPTDSVNADEPATNAAAYKQTSPQPKPKANTDQIAVENTTEPGFAQLTLLPWGEIWIDDQRYGVSPPMRKISLAPGTYRIELRNPGLPTEVRTISFSKGENPAIFHNFNEPGKAPATSENKATNTGNNSNQRQQNQIQEPAPTITESPIAITGERTLNIKILPWGEIFLDGKMAGVTPPLHQLKLSPGAHIIEIRHPNYPTKTIQISAADPVSSVLEHHFK